MNLDKISETGYFQRKFTVKLKFSSTDFSSTTSKFSGFTNWLDKTSEFRDFTKIEMHLWLNSLWFGYIEKCFNLLKVFSRLGSSTNVKVSFQTGFTLFILVSVFFFPHGLSRTCIWTCEFGALTTKIMTVEYSLGKLSFKIQISITHLLYI